MHRGGFDMIQDPNPHLTCHWEAPVDWETLRPGDVPNEPGFYVFTDYGDAVLQPTPTQKGVLYVGIATGSLRKRLQRYKRGDTTGITDMHRGGLMLLLSRAAAAHIDDAGKITHSRQQKPIQVTTRRAGQPLQIHTLEPDRIYVRWAVDPRAAIEAMLIRMLQPRFNTMHQPD
jgi:hypothetical protein